MAFHQYDEELLGRRMRRLRFPRLRRSSVYLLVIDVTLIVLLLCEIEPLITLLRRNEELFGPRFRPDEKPETGTDPEAQTIPHILHQTCATDIIPEAWVHSQQSCREAYSNFTYMLWTDELARDFIAREYPWFLHVWDGYPFPIQRADSIRYFVLHHFGGIYLDMDTLCKEPFPVDGIGHDGPHALFKSTLPTGVTNDFMMSTARHPAFAVAISRLPVFYKITRLWARLEPYVAIMLSSGPLFLTLALKDFLLGESCLPSPAVQVIHFARLEPYITDLESSTWHRKDTKLLMWLGERPWSWFGLGAVGLVIGVYVFNRALLLLCKAPRRILSVAHSLKRQKH
ncbi:hypothetical protein VTK73DRAFT_4333 [Phialemonium thermophilum]|uniref:Mannosyl phosphorylinositol ceramide synthase SUR1 n=1 Tax=Phialemonium thermophilum TaxID=223376 RepID=A0ABR3WUY2_9PEZI